MTIEGIRERGLGKISEREREREREREFCFHSVLVSEFLLNP